MPRRYGRPRTAASPPAGHEGGWFRYQPAGPPPEPSTVERIEAFRGAVSRLSGVSGADAAALGRRYRDVTAALTGTDPGWAPPEPGAEAVRLDRQADDLADALVATGNAYWARRMLYETLLVAAAAREGGLSLPSQLAVDGVDEFLELVGDTPRARPVRVVLASVRNRLVWDVAWDPSGLQVVKRHFPVDEGAGWSADCADWAADLGAADLRLSGPGGDVWMMLWSPSIRPRQVVAVGDTGLVAELRSVAESAVARAM